MSQTQSLQGLSHMRPDPQLLCLSGCRGSACVQRWAWGQCGTSDRGTSDCRQDDGQARESTVSAVTKARGWGRTEVCPEDTRRATFPASPASGHSVQRISVKCRLWFCGSGESRSLHVLPAPGVPLLLVQGHGATQGPGGERHDI